ncbi:Actin/actin-like protein [Linderina pennispora]|uniref:Actin/actin-like protein n=1 Tax=Linderina pennispora TaxID=61395 RepID=A0A1Y1WL88_9FUNG|nr:Actin/actin-like protein [Linderina pennispora]ORX73956.1 Actin/actin-like protein [Linderina pennispora]
MPTYGGDEVNALVIDVGSTWTRAGFAGEDMPKAYFPSHVGYVETEVEATETVDTPASKPATETDVEMNGQPTEANGVRSYYVGDSESATWRANMEIGRPLEHGLVKDWDIYEKIWEYAFKSRLHVNPSEHPVMVSEAAWNTTALREKLIEMAFEKFSSPAFYVCKTPVLAAFGTGKHTGLVVDVGGEMASACAVYEGFCLSKTIVKQELGGELLSEQILAMLKDSQQYEPTPIFDIKAKAAVETLQQPQVERFGRAGTTDSFLHDMRLRAVQEFKEATCEFIETPFMEQNAGSRPHKPFEFPDGFNMSVGSARFKIPEILFDPNTYMVKRPKRLENVQLMGLHELAIKSVVASDIDLRPQLLNNVVLAGAGASLFPAYADRMSFMLTNSIPGGKIKLHAPNTNTERKVSSWLGGSILASLGTFHQLWISRAEYDEHGASIVDKKCQ